MHFKKASLLFTAAFSLSAGAITDSLSRPSVAAGIAESEGVCYSVGKYAITEEDIINNQLTGYDGFKDIYEQPWSGEHPVVGNTQTAQPSLLSESLPDYNFVEDVMASGPSGFIGIAYYNGGNYNRGEEVDNPAYGNFKGPGFEYAQNLGEVLCPKGLLGGPGGPLGLDGVPPDLRAALIARLVGTSEAERQQKLGLLLNALLLPKNVTAAGGLATQAYVNDLADTIFDRLPTRKFTPAGIEEENGDVDLSTITLDETVYSESNDLTSIYTDSNGTRVWARGFAGSKQPYSTGGASGKNGLYYPDVYNDFYSNHGGFVIGVDTSVSEHIQLGVFGNYGTINLNQFDQGTGGGSWNPSGFGGGITASYVDESFYVQGLFGATGFSGDNKRQIRIPGVIDETYTANKNTTSYVGALRVGAPLTWGDTILEPQATAIWNGNNDSSYTESGRYESLALKVDSYSDSFLETTIGAKLAWPIKQSNGNLLVPNVRVAWLADWDTGNGAVKFKRKNSKADITAEIPSNQEMQNGVLLEGGVDYAIVQGPTSAWKLYAKGGAKVWANANTDWRASGGVTFSFGGAPQGSPTIEVVEELSVEPASEPAPAAPAPVRGLW